MNTDSVIQAILMLCSFFNKSESRTIKPLTPTEYSRLAVWLYANKYDPSDFLNRKDELLSNWEDPKKKITQERLDELLQRSASMGFAIEKWQQQNVWVLGRSSQEYPKVLKEALGDTRPPLLYGIGNKALLSTKGIGFVGSRDTNADDETFTQALAQQAVEQGYTVVSGGAKGVDQTSMMAALEAGGSVIGVLADSLLKAATKPQYRKALQEGRLLLITPYYPEAGFHPGSAMGRNKYIYLLSVGVVVAKSGEDGGTWEGAKQNLKKQWVPLWVRDLKIAGNEKLIELGGQRISESNVDFAALKSSFSFDAIASTQAKDSNTSKQSKATKQKKADVQVDIFNNDLLECPMASDSEEKPDLNEQQRDDKPESSPDDEIEIVLKSAGSVSNNEQSQREPLGPFLALFYTHLQRQDNALLTPNVLADKYPELSEAIIKQWLKKLEEQGFLERQGKSLAYTLVTK